MTDPLDWIPGKLAALAAEDLLRVRKVVTPLAGGRCDVDGRTLINFATNDYLGLAFDSRLIDAAHVALDECGTGARASALVTGRTRWHAELEERLAAFEGTEAALLFPTGYAANVGAIAALAGTGDTVYCDRLNHASLVDGCRLSRAKLRVYPHGDLKRLERILIASSSGRRLVVTDSVFSMDGDHAPLVRLCDVAERSGAMLLVDEAHGTGVFGTHGRGVCELAGVEHRVAVRVGTLSKAAGVVGGFVAGSRSLIDWLWNNARAQMFSTALPPMVCGAACVAIDVIEQEPERRARVLRLGELFRSRLSTAGIPIDHTTCGPIVPLVMGGAAEAMQLSEELHRRGFLVPAIRPPTVPRGTSRLRVSLSASHTEDDIRQLVQALGELWQSRH